ncbi:recombinase RecT [Streptomyces sp. NPDC053048]|uniref:recombinase RecT n=1 Tax=Streptomyces sp. NPDC053048 TaxID=3365694 RepID=UPI0037CD997A
MTVSTLPIRAQQAAPTAPGGALSLGRMTPQEAWHFCQGLAGTPLLPDVYRNNPASVLWAMEYGRALGLDVVTTITTIHVIKGKPTQSADLMLSRAREAGHKVRIKSERDRCVVTIVRRDDPDDENVIEWTLDDAVTARLCELRNGRPYARDQKGQPTAWEKFPRAMLRARAIAECVRAACPEVLHGAIYTPEELGAVVDQDGNAVHVERADAPVRVQATVVQQAPEQPAAVQDGPPRDFLAEALAAEAAEQVRALWVEAQAAGAPREYLADLSAIGAEKPGARTTDQEQDEQQLGQDAEGGTAPAPADQEEHAAALADLLAAGAAVGLTAQQVEQITRQEAGSPAAECTVEQLAAVAADLRAAVEEAAA